MGIKQETIRRAVSMLQAASAKFHIVCEDGTVIGEPIVPVKPARTKRGLQGPRNHVMIMDKFETLKPGDVVVFNPQVGDTLLRLQSNVCATASRKFGKGACTSTITGNTVELLRVF